MFRWLLDILLRRVFHSIENEAPTGAGIWNETSIFWTMLELLGRSDRQDKYSERGRINFISNICTHVHISQAVWKQTWLFYTELSFEYPLLKVSFLYRWLIQLYWSIFIVFKFNFFTFVPPDLDALLKRTVRIGTPPHGKKSMVSVLAAKLVNRHRRLLPPPVESIVVATIAYFEKWHSEIQNWTCLVSLRIANWRNYLPRLLSFRVRLVFPLVKLLQLSASVFQLALHPEDFAASVDFLRSQKKREDCKLVT